LRQRREKMERKREEITVYNPDKSIGKIGSTF
jgi:hypothetical protein